MTAFKDFTGGDAIYARIINNFVDLNDEEVLSKLNGQLKEISGNDDFHDRHLYSDVKLLSKEEQLQTFEKTIRHLQIMGRFNDQLKTALQTNQRFVNNQDIQSVLDRY